MHTQNVVGCNFMPSPVPLARPDNFFLVRGPELGSALACAFWPRMTFTFVVETGDGPLLSHRSLPPVPLARLDNFFLARGPELGSALTCCFLKPWPGHFID